KVVDIKKWIFKNDDEDSLHALREYMGLSKITWKEVRCKRCEVLMTSQFNGSVRYDYFCNYCRSYVNHHSGYFDF
ncbi:MAG: hypothetical protein EB120_11860, partial [Proteobacteria bacterium]|nr:hypothetical protein [Pseudomonadota bacterium]